MSSGEVLSRLDRIYAAVKAVTEADLTKFPPTITKSATRFYVYQDFIGGLTPPELSNLAHGVIHNIANLNDHLRKWARENGLDLNRVEDTRRTSLPIRVLADLSDNDKHGYPPRNGGHSRLAPKLGEVKRVLRLNTGSIAESSVAIFMTPQGPQQRSSGSGSSSVIVTAQVVDARENLIGDLYNLELEALTDWETLLREFGLTGAREA